MTLSYHFEWSGLNILSRARSHGWKLSKHRGSTLRFDRQTTESAMALQPPVHPPPHTHSEFSCLCEILYVKVTHANRVSLCNGLALEPALFHILYASFKHWNDIFTFHALHLIIALIKDTTATIASLCQMLWSAIRGPHCCQCEEGGGAPGSSVWQQPL